MAWYRELDNVVWCALNRNISEMALGIRTALQRRAAVRSPPWLSRDPHHCRSLSTTPPRCRDDREERYIQYSKVPTMHFQTSLPRLPVPKLPDTCRRYLAALRPVVGGEEEWRETGRLVEEFGREGGEGEELHKQLCLRDSQNKHTSFIAGPWYDMYLESRLPLVLNYNPFIAFKQDPRNPSQAERAASMIASAVRFRASMLDNKLEPEVYHLNPDKSDTETFRNLIRFVPPALSWYAAYMVNAFPLDMSQYSRLFNSTRIPRQGKDELVSHGNEGHVIVMRNGHFYSVEAVQPNGLPVPISQLHSRLLGILSDATPPPSHPVGYLTAVDRDNWAGLREELISDQTNRASLQAIDSAMFVLCLDDSEPETPEELSHIMLHNHGHNRWFDKSFSLLMSRNGYTAVSFEHAWGDGVAVMRFFNEVFRDTTDRPLLPRPSSSSSGGGGAPPTEEGITRLGFELSDGVRAAVEQARAEVGESTGSLSVSSMEYQGLGKTEVKKHGLSPDAVMQVAFQIAYYRQYQCSVPSYESCSTAGFKHGRTETIRPASEASKACAAAFQRDSSAGAEEMRRALEDACSYHSKLLREAATGQGFDRHLFGLKVLAASEGRTLPIFQDPSYSYLNEIVLSTSTVPSDAVLMGGFAPVSPDGYGVGYAVMDDWMGSQVTTYPSRDGVEFNTHLKSTLDDVKAVLNGRNFK